MINETLAESFHDSLTEEVSGCVGEFMELGIDAMMDDGLAKDIPFLSTFTSIYKIGNTIRERHHLKKLALFLNEINCSAANEEKRKTYRAKFVEKKEYRNSELEYVTIVLDHYIDFDKPKMLAKLYLCYLDSIINWIEFKKYAEVISRFLPGDLIVLLDDSIENSENDTSNIDAILRLLAMGLVSQRTGTNVEVNDGNLELSDVKGYSITPFGAKLRRIISRQDIIFTSGG